MQEATATDALLDRARGIDEAAFEHLCKMLVEDTEHVRTIELTPFRADGGIDVRGTVGRDFYRARFGVQVKQYTDSVGAPAMRDFVGALSQHDYQFGCFVTPSEFTGGAVEIARSETTHPIELVDGDCLADVMLEQELGVVAVGGQYQIDEAFWEKFETTGEADLVKSDAVPQADSFDVLNVVLRGLDEGYRYKHEVLEYVIEETGEEWTPRQADYYPQAGWALGYVHKDTDGEYQGRSMRQWGLTRDGQEYLTYLREGDEAAAERDLVEHVREAAIVQRTVERLREEGTLSHDDLGRVIATESQLNGTTANRRRSTVGNWLATLPEVRQVRDGQSYTYRYVDATLSDY